LKESQQYGTIGTLHSTESIHNIAICTLLHKKRTTILQYRNAGNKLTKDSPLLLVPLHCEKYRNIESRDTHSSCEVYQDKLQRQRCSPSVLYRYNFTYNACVLL